MSWLRARGLTRWLATPVDRPVGIQVEHTVPPAAVVPVEAVLHDTPDGARLEAMARIKHAVRLVELALQGEAQKVPALRDGALVDLCLEVRSALRPSEPDAEVLCEVPSVRPSVPVVPGGAS